MQKMIITKPGFDAATETNPDNMIFSSDYNTLKYHLSGDGTIAIVGDNTEKTTVAEVVHGLGYTPFFIVFCSNLVADGEGDFYQLVPTEDSAIGRIVRAEAWADDTKLYISLRNKSTFDYTVNFYYKIFRNNLGF